jgi:hypothetical protein
VLAQAPPVAETVPLPLTFSVSVVVLPPGVTAAVKVAVTFRAALIVSVHVLVVPEHAPLQPSNVEPEPAAAVSVTFEPTARFAVQTVAPPPQLIPPPVTVPFPVTLTDNGTVEVPTPVKLAVTVLALFIVTVQVVVVPEQAPPQPRKPAPESGIAVSVTVDPVVSFAVQPDPPAEVHAIPPPVTVPLPVTDTVSVWVAAVFANVACTVWSLVPIATVQLTEVPEHAPLQPLKV